MKSKCTYIFAFLCMYQIQAGSIIDAVHKPLAVLKQELEKNKDNVNVPNKDGKTALFFLKMEDPEALEKFKLLIENDADIYHKNRWGESLLHCLRHPDILEKLIEMGLSVDSLADNLNTPLMTQMNYHVHLPALDVLLQHTSNLLHKNVHGENFFHHLFQFGSISDVKHVFELIGSRISSNQFINEQTLKKQTILHLSVAGYDPKKVKYLLSLPGIDVHVLDDEGHMPIHYACSTGDLESIKLLIKHKADLSKKTLKGRNVIDCVLRKLRDLNITYKEGEGSAIPIGIAAHIIQQLKMKNKSLDSQETGGLIAKMVHKSILNPAERQIILDAINHPHTLYLKEFLLDRDVLWILDNLKIAFERHGGYEISPYVALVHLGRYAQQKNVQDTLKRHWNGFESILESRCYHTEKHICSHKLLIRKILEDVMAGNEVENQRFSDLRMEDMHRRRTFEKNNVQKEMHVSNNCENQLVNNQQKKMTPKNRRKKKTA